MPNKPINMTTKKKRSKLPLRYYNPQLPQESLGGVLGSIATGAGSGAMVGGAFGGVGALPGALIGGASGLIKGLFGHRQEKLTQAAQEAEAAERDKLLAEQSIQQTELAEQDRRDMQIQTKINAMPQAPVYAPVVANGGLIAYNGPSHMDSPQGGIPVDSAGNPIKVTGKNPVALVEGGEIARYQPDGGTFIYSKKLGYAPKARSIQKNFQKALGKDLNGIDKMAREAMNLRLDNLAEEQELTKMKCGGRMKEDGGSLPQYVDGGVSRFASNMNTLFGTNFGNQRTDPGRAGFGIDSNNQNTLQGDYGSPYQPYQYQPAYQYQQRTDPGRAGFGDIRSSNYNMLQDIPQQQMGISQGSQSIPYQPALSLPVSATGVTPQVGGGLGQDSFVTSNYANYNAGQGPLQTQDVSDTVLDPNKNANRQGFNFGNLLSPVGHILSGIASHRDYNRLKREGADEVDLGPDVDPARMVAEQVSFAPERAMAREQASTGSAVAARTARNLGLSGSQAAASIGTSRLGIQRAAGQQIGMSMQKEAVTNAQFRQQASAANMQASQQARLTNAQREAQEGAYNAMLRSQYRERLRQSDPLSSWLRIGASYLGDNVSYGLDQQTRQLYAPNAQFAQPSPFQWLLGQRGKTTFKGPQLNTTTD